MVKLNLTDENQTVETEGKAVVAFVIDPADDEADLTSMMLGKGNPKREMLSVARGLGALVNQLFDNSVDQCLIGVAMNRIIKDVICGETDTKTEVVKNEIERSDEEHD